MHTDNLPTAHIIHSVYAFHIDMKMCADITDNMVIIAIAKLMSESDKQQDLF